MLTPSLKLVKLKISLNFEKLTNFLQYTKNNRPRKFSLWAQFNKANEELIITLASFISENVKVRGSRFTVKGIIKCGFCSTWYNKIFLIQTFEVQRGKNGSSMFQNSQFFQIPEFMVFLQNGISYLICLHCLICLY